MGAPSKFTTVKFHFLFLLSTLFFTSYILSQTVIREKISIKQEHFVKPYLSTEGIMGGNIQLNWNDNSVAVTFIVSEPCEEPYIVPWHNATSFNYSLKGRATGNYSILIGMNFQDVYPVDVHYSLPTGESGVMTINSNMSGNATFQTLVGFYESVHDFYLGFTNAIICNENSIVRISPYLIYNYNCGITAIFNSQTPVSVALESELDCYIFDIKQQTDYGKSTTTTLSNLKNLEIKLRSNYEGEMRKGIIVTIRSGSIERSREVIVEGKGNFQLGYYFAENEEEKVLPGEEKFIEVEAESNNYCDSYTLPESTKFNVEITSGEKYGVCKELENGSEGSILSGLNHEDGILRFLFNANGNTPEGTDSIKIRVWTTDINIEPIEIPLVIIQSRIKVTFSPPNIMPGDTADVVLRKIDEDGNVVDFEEDQRFDVKLIVGSEYGDIYIPQWNELTDEGWYVEQGLKFIAATEIDSLPVESVLKVNTSGGFAGSLLPEDGSIEDEYRKINKSQSSKNVKVQKRNISVQNKTTDRDVSKSVMIGGPEEPLWGIGTVKIGGGNDCSEALQCDDPINPKLILQKTERDECDNYPQEDGVTLPYFDNFLNGFQIVACYSSVLNRWQLQIGNKLQFSSSICLRENKYQYIFNIQQVKNIPKSECDKAEEDFFSLLTLNRKPGQYFIVPVAILHEQIHVEQLEALINSIIYESNILNDISNHIITCNEINNKEFVEAITTRLFSNKIQDLFVYLRRQWKRMDNLANEQIVQNDPRIKSIIMQFYEELECN